MATARELELLDALEAALEWIDAVPQETVLPVMPGFDRDWVNGLVHDVKAERAACPTTMVDPTEEPFITDYKAAFAKANAHLPLPRITARGRGWYDLSSVGRYCRKSEIVKMTQVLRDRVK